MPRDRADTAPRTAAGRALHLAIAENERLSLNGKRMNEYAGAILDIEREAAAPDDPAPLICAACGGTNEPVVMVPLHPRCTDAPAPRPCDCGSEKYGGVHIDTCTRTREYARLPSETGDE